MRGVQRQLQNGGGMRFAEAVGVVVRLRRALAFPSFCVFLLIASSCSEKRGPSPSTNQASSASQSEASKSSEATNASPSQKQSDSIFAQIDNQMNVGELRERLDEVKTIEREARKMVLLRRKENWMVGVSECMRIMKRLKPRAVAISDEYQRMLSPAGIHIASAAMNLVGCIDCVEDDDDDCGSARDFIDKAERELKKEMRRR